MQKKENQKNVTRKKRLLVFFNTYRNWVFLGILFIAFVFLRFYQLESRLPLGWDQIDNAWAAKRIIVDHNYPLLGMQAKENSGINIGPAYYYLITPIYFLFDLYPIASGYIAGLTAIFTFLVLFFIIKKLFTFEVALIALFINTTSYFIAAGDRVQWPVNFIVPVSLIIFYCLYKVLLGESKYLFFLALAVGFSTQIHFTSVFYGPIILLSIPFFPRTKKTIVYSLLSLPLFLIWLTPVFYFSLITKNSQGMNLHSYLQQNYHGLHLVRILQLLHDAFIEFVAIIRSSLLDYFDFLLPVIFAILYYYPKKLKKHLLFCYLMALWFIVPWIAFSTYKGELTNYYFFMTRPIGLIILAYLTYRLLLVENIIPRLAVLIFWGYFMVTNVNDIVYGFSTPNYLSNATPRIIPAAQSKQKFIYNEHTLDAYLYYYYKYYKNGKVN